MTGTDTKRNPARSCKKTEPWDQTLAKFSREVTLAVSQRSNICVTSTSKVKATAAAAAATAKTSRAKTTKITSTKSETQLIAHKSPGLKLTSSILRVPPRMLGVNNKTSPTSRHPAKPVVTSIEPPKRIVQSSSKRKSDEKPASKAQVVKAVPDASIDESPGRALRSDSRLSVAKRISDVSAIHNTRASKAAPKLNVTKTSPKPITSKAVSKRKVVQKERAAVVKRPRKNAEVPLRIPKEEPERDTDEENIPPPPVLVPYYATRPVNSASDVSVIDTVPSTSSVDKFGVYKFDQLDLFGDLETEEERAEEYKGSGHYSADIGEVIQDSGFKYQITRKMGFGNFSLAWLCYETKKNAKKFVALKIYKASNKSTHEEIKILQKVKNHDHIVRYFRSFTIKRYGLSYDCVLFEPLGGTLLSLLKRVNNDVAGLKVEAIKKITRHVLLGLQHLHNVMGFVHTDIKPENILVNVTDRSLFLAVKDVYDLNCDGKGMRAVPLRHKPFKNGLQKVKDDLGIILDNMPSPLSIEPAKTTQDRDTVSDEVCWDVVKFKLIDLGNATPPLNKPNTSGTFEYRAPENPFGAPLTYNFDVWSVGAVVVELATNTQLFTTVNNKHDSRDLLKSISRCLGNVPHDIYKEFSDPANLLQEFSASHSLTFSPRYNLAKRLSLEYFSQQEINDMVNFLTFVFNFDPKKRPSASECLAHEWLAN
uniref:Protein kinase domain-containing protein n=1 Tax=Panagrolaimus sp. ES5 TaxID=591445 RepID=A0AC34GWU9_9BILA